MTKALATEFSDHLSASYWMSVALRRKSKTMKASKLSSVLTHFVVLLAAQFVSQEY